MLTSRGPERKEKAYMKILVIDVGGTNVKVLATGHDETLRIASGRMLTPAGMVKKVKEATEGWEYEVVSIGYPGFVFRGRPICDPANLGSGWVGFDFTEAFGCPVRVINDAAMQALGSYNGGSMLFLGLGTGLGSAMVIDGVLEPMEIAHLPYRKGRTFEDYLGLDGLERLGKKRWRDHVAAAVAQLAPALQADDVVLGGGNSKLLKELPPGSRIVDNANAILGGYRLWEAANERMMSGGA
jgi:predicted NBD/HSP70 family sugar kinase